MSFNKRWYNKDQIIDRSKTNNFGDFKRWILNPDAHITSDELSQDFINCFFKLEDDGRSLLKESLSESEEFVMDLLKCIKVSNNTKNRGDHNNSIKTYVSLFTNKWNSSHYEKYKKIIDQNG